LLKTASKKLLRQIYDKIFKKVKSSGGDFIASHGKGEGKRGKQKREPKSSFLAISPLRGREILVCSIKHRY